MKNKQGFTLVEVLAVILILISIIAIITPKILIQFQNSENIIQKEQINTLINTARIYTSQHTEILPDELEKTIITITELKNAGLIKSEQVIDPKTREPINGCIIVTYKINKYKYSFTNNEEDCQ